MSTVLETTASTAVTGTAETVTGVLPPCPSSTVTVNVSV